MELLGVKSVAKLGAKFRSHVASKVGTKVGIHARKIVGNNDWNPGS